MSAEIMFDRPILELRRAGDNSSVVLVARDDRERGSRIASHGRLGQGWMPPDEVVDGGLNVAVIVVRFC